MFQHQIDNFLWHLCLLVTEVLWWSHFRCSRLLAELSLWRLTKATLGAQISRLWTTEWTGMESCSISCLQFYWRVWLDQVQCWQTCLAVQDEVCFLIILQGSARLTAHTDGDMISPSQVAASDRDSLQLHCEVSFFIISSRRLDYYFNWHTDWETGLGDLTVRLSYHNPLSLYIYISCLYHSIYYNTNSAGYQNNWIINIVCPVLRVSYLDLEDLVHVP